MGFKGGTGTPVYLEDSYLKDKDYLEMLSTADSMAELMSKIPKEKKLPTQKEYNKIRDRYELIDKEVYPRMDAKFSDILEKKYNDVDTIDPFDRGPMELMLMDKETRDKEKEFSKLDEDIMAVVKELGLDYDKLDRNYKPNDAVKNAGGGRMDFSNGTDRPDDEFLKIPKDDFKRIMDEFIKDQKTQEELRKKKAMGGRIGFSDGSPGYWEQAQELFDQVGGEEATGLTLIDFANKYLSLDRNNKAMGGSMGSEVPIRRNQGGITELDYRNTGGFVPIGVKEKEDDVPAMLSKNEFVFTADAVRNAGGGDVNKGAQKMYNTMKSLENKVV
jgi:hypothetical protein